jgi:hypothetical protein
MLGAMCAADHSASERLEPLLPHLTDPLLRRLALYWIGKCRGERLPARADIDPAEISDLLPFLYLIDVERDASRYRYRFRLIGTDIVSRAGRDATGSYLDELAYSSDRVVTGSDVAEEYRAMIESGLPRFDKRYALWPDREHQFYHRLVLPLASDGRTVDMLIGILHVQPEPAGAGRRFKTERSGNDGSGRHTR